MAIRLLGRLVFGTVWALGSGMTMSVYNTSQTPVQVVNVAGVRTYNVHLYILIDTGDATKIAQGGAYWRWGDSGPWQAAPTVLYDEHQVDPVTVGSTTRGYNIVWSQSLGNSPAPADTMSYRVWALAEGTSKPEEVYASAPVVDVSLPPSPLNLQALEVSLFKAVAFSAGRRDGVHVHLVINVWPPQQPNPPDYQLFADIAIGTGRWTAADAPSRFEHTYDQPMNSSKVCSRYNLSWRPSPGAVVGAGCANVAGRAPAVSTSLSFRVHVTDIKGATGMLTIPDVPLVCVSKGDVPNAQIIAV